MVMSIKANKAYRELLRLLVVPCVLLAVAVEAKADAYAEFDPRFFGGSQFTTTDLERFTRGNTTLPGTYDLDVLVNDDWLGKAPIHIIDQDGNSVLCMKDAQAKQWGIKITGLHNEQHCIDLAQEFPELVVQIDHSKQALRLTVPQAYLERSVRGYIDPEYWDNGISAGFVNYNLNASTSKFRNNASYSSFFGNLNAGVNVEAWRLRSDMTYSYQNGKNSQINVLNLYAQRPLPKVNSQLTVGRFYTPSELFNSFQFIGMSLATDSRMWPDSLNGFAPTIRGVAESNAQVRVYQNGSQIYETTVTAGPFIISDLYNTGHAGDLEVVIFETNGQQKRFVVPYTNSAQLMRPGMSRFSLSSGRYYQRDSDFDPTFIQGTYQHGLNNFITAYSGGLMSKDYLAGIFGIALNTPMGAVAADVTHSSTDTFVDSLQGLERGGEGYSYRLTYNKIVSATETNIALAAYRFSSRNYLDFSDFARLHEDSRKDSLQPSLPWEPENSAEPYFYYPSAQRNRVQLIFNQPINARSSIFISGSAQSYWENDSHNDMTYQAAYSRSYEWGYMTLNVSRMLSSMTQSQTNVVLSASIPLGRKDSPARRSSLSSSVSRSSDKNTVAMTSLHGVTGEQSQLSYSMYHRVQDQAGGYHGQSSGVSGQYYGALAQVSAAASMGSDGYRQGNLGLSGSVVAHANGINFTREMGDTFALVHAPGAEGTLISGSNSRIAANGYGVASMLLPYRNNGVSLNPKGSSMDVEIVGSQKNTAPTSGAIILLEYEVKSGRAVLLNVNQNNGQNLPMGAEVFNQKGDSLGQVGQGNRIFLRGVEDQEQLWVRWGIDSQSQCQINYQTIGVAVQQSLLFERQNVDCLMVEESRAQL